jgi:FlaA1/EpsC-like NDP-sugar epimerase
MMRRRTAHLVRSAKFLGRRSKQLLMVLADVVAMPAALWTALMLHVGTANSQYGVNDWLYVSSVLLTIPIFVRLGLYRAVIRFLGIQAALAIAIGVTFSTIGLVVIDRYFLDASLSPAVFAIYFALAILYAGASRFGAREFLRIANVGAAPVVIYGAGVAGAQLCSSLLTSQHFRPVAFIDDNVKFHGARVCGLQVLAPGNLAELRRRRGVGLVFLALPSASRRRRGAILEALSAQGFKVQTVPDISEMVSGNARLEEVRDIDVHDLLGRDPVPPNNSLLSACIRGKSILVTGAGGSIGSELCRQIMALAPRRLVMLEVSELALYEIERELRSLNARLGNRIDLVALLGNAHHKQRVREIITTFAVQTIYHAAAYKHVPIVEHNMIEGVHNNIFATYNTAEAAMECRVETFVLISTDKAVNPTNVMGCTKRVAEMVLQGLHQRGHGTRFCMVRFGNVL